MTGQITITIGGLTGPSGARSSFGMHVARVFAAHGPVIGGLFVGEEWVSFGPLQPTGNEYILKTNQEIRQQVIQHRSRIRTKVMTAPLVSHFL